MPPSKKKLKKRPKRAPKAAKPLLDSESERDLKVSTDMQEWVKLGAPPPIVRGLSQLGFTVPTPIQRAALPPAINEGVDIIGAAETVS